MKKAEIIREMAYAIERKSCGSARYWTAEQFKIWCHSDPVGKRSFRDSKQQAEAAYKRLAQLGVISVDQ